MPEYLDQCRTVLQKALTLKGMSWSNEEEMDAALGLVTSAVDLVRSIASLNVEITDLLRGYDDGCRALGYGEEG